MKFEKFKTLIINSIKNDDIKGAFKLFFEDSNLIDNERSKELIVNNSTYSRIESSYRQGSIDWETMSVNKNKIIISLIDIINLVEKDIDLKRTNTPWNMKPSVPNSETKKPIIMKTSDTDSKIDLLVQLLLNDISTYSKISSIENLKKALYNRLKFLDTDSLYKAWMVDGHDPSMIISSKDVSFVSNFYDDDGNSKNKNNTNKKIIIPHSSYSKTNYFTEYLPALMDLEKRLDNSLKEFENLIILKN